MSSLSQSISDSISKQFTSLQDPCWPIVLVALVPQTLTMIRRTTLRQSAQVTGLGKPVMVYIVNSPKYGHFHGVISKQGTRQDVLSFDNELRHASLHPYSSTHWFVTLRYKFFPPAKIHGPITDDAVVARVPPSAKDVLLGIASLITIVGITAWGIWWCGQGTRANTTRAGAYDEEAAAVHDRLKVMPAPNGFRAEWSVIPQEDLDLLRGAEPQLYFLIGPKAVGKSYALEALPSLLNRRALLVPYAPSADHDVITAVYEQLRMMAPKHAPGRPHAEATTAIAKLAYIGKACKGAVILIDCQRSRDVDWARMFCDQARTLWHGANVTVVATTSEGVNVAESKGEPRRHVRIVPELPWDVTKDVLCAAWRSQHPAWTASDPPAYLLEAAKYVPRHFYSLQELPTKYPTEEAFTSNGAGLRGIGEVVERVAVAFLKAGCPTYKPPFAEGLRQGGDVSASQVTAWCRGHNEVVSMLMKATTGRTSPSVGSSTSTTTFTTPSTGSQRHRRSDRETPHQSPP